jgi:hypothetical protein
MKFKTQAKLNVQLRCPQIVLAISTFLFLVKLQLASAVLLPNISHHKKFSRKANAMQLSVVTTRTSISPKEKREERRIDSYKTK